MEPILFFVDETKLANKSAKIQTIIPVFESQYREFLVPHSQKVLRKYGGKNAREFKGSKIKPGTRRHFYNFLKEFRNVGTNNATQTPLRTVITLDGPVLEESHMCKEIERHLIFALAHIGIEDVPTKLVARSIARQLTWFQDHLADICEETIKNPIHLLFDEQYGDAKKIQKKRAVLRNGNEITSFKTLEEILTIAVKSLLDNRNYDLRVVPNIEKITFRDSKTELGIQAADLLSNLYFNFLLHKVLRKEKSATKAELLQELIPGVDVTDELRRNLIGREGDDKYLELTDPNVGIRVVLGELARFVPEGS